MRFKEYLQENELNEAILTKPDLNKAAELTKQGKEEEADKIYRQYTAYSSSIFKLINSLTGLTGYWYTASSKDPLKKKLKEMNPKELSNFRSKMAVLVKKAHNMEKVKNELMKEAQELVKELEKGK